MPARMKMMTFDEIRVELGWSREMVYTLLPNPDSDSIRRNKTIGSYTRGLYRRERVLAVAQTPEALLAKKRWDETVHGWDPRPGWTMRLRDIGEPLGIASRAVGKILDLMGFRSERGPSDQAVASGYGVRRYDGDWFHVDWHRDRVVEAIRLAARSGENPAVADALAAAIAKEEAKGLSAAQGRRRQENEAAQLRDRQAQMEGLKAELAALVAGHPDMGLLDAVEFITSHPGDRLALYCALKDPEPDIGAERLSMSSASIAADLAVLERRAVAEGFQEVQGLSPIWVSRIADGSAVVAVTGLRRDATGWFQGNLGPPFGHSDPLLCGPKRARPF
jgi:hypothetical protein